MNARQPHFTASGTCTTVLGRLGIASMLLVLGAGAPAMSQDAAQAAPAPAADAAAATDLRAVFIDVGGKVQWRAGDKDQWRDAKVNDEVAPGVEVRTGLRSHAALRMRNATVLLDAGTMFQLPTSVQDGEVLRTTAAIKHGRADFKVDKVGLSNDFKVVTPSTTLAVRGTEFAIATGALKQVEVVGARRNAINAIELKYALNNSTVQLSGNATSSSGVNHPAHQSAVSASPPLASAAAPPVTSQGEAIRNAAAGETPASSGSSASVQQGNRSTARAEKASGNSGGSTGVVSRVQEQITQANERAAQAIEYLLRADTELELIEAQRDTVIALRGLAQTQLAAAREALAQHASDVGEAEGFLVEGEGYFEEFDGLRRQIVGNGNGNGNNGNGNNGNGNGNGNSGNGNGNDGNRPQGLFEQFDAELSDARQLLAKLEVLLPNSGTGTSTSGGQGDGASLVLPGGDDAAALIAQLRDSLSALAANLDETASLRSGMLEAQRDIADVIRDLRNAANIDEAGISEARRNYEAAFGELRDALDAGTDAERLASGARDAVAALRALVAQLSAASPTAELVQSAQLALARLQSASAGLTQTLSALSSIRAARDAARDDSRAAALGRIEQIYVALLARQASVGAGLLAVSTGLAANEADMKDLAHDALPYLSIGAQRIAFVEMGAARSAADAPMTDLDAMVDSSNRLEAIVSLSGEGLGLIQQQALIADGAMRDAGNFRDEALAQRDLAEFALARTSQALALEEISQAQASAAAAGTFATAAEGAAAAATGAEGIALDAAEQAAALSSEVLGLVTGLGRFGSTAGEFAAAANERAASVSAAAAAVSGLRGEVSSYYVLVTNHLASRLGLSLEAVQASPLGQAMAHADQLQSEAQATADRAGDLAQTAGTNAQRLFFNGLQTYASVAANNAAAAQSSYVQAAILAAEARGFGQEARGFANEAQGQLVAQGVSQQSGGGQ